MLRQALRTGLRSRPWRLALALGLLAVLGAATWAWGLGPKRIGRTVRAFPSPGDYPEGLAWDGHYLWSNNFSNATLYKVDPVTGATVGTYTDPRLPAHPEGLAWDGTDLWTCDHDNLSGQDIMKVAVTPAGVRVVATYQKPPGAGNPVGLEWDGSNLWLACFGAQVGEKSELWKLDPKTLQSVGFFRLPVWWVEDLAWDGSHLWSVDWLNDLGFAIDVTTGDTLDTYTPAGPNPVGQAWDGQNLWLSDTLNDSLYATDISDTRSAVEHTTWSDFKRLFNGGPR
jgi:sugar lactone lactonase YvrE